MGKVVTFGSIFLITWDAASSVVRRIRSMAPASDRPMPLLTINLRRRLLEWLVTLAENSIFRCTLGIFGDFLVFFIASLETSWFFIGFCLIFGFRVVTLLVSSWYFANFRRFGPDLPGHSANCPGSAPRSGIFKT